MGARQSTWSLLPPASNLPPSPPHALGEEFLAVSILVTKIRAPPKRCARKEAGPQACIGDGWQGNHAAGEVSLPRTASSSLILPVSIY